MATTESLRRGIQQFEAGTGRRISPQALQSLLAAELEVDARRQAQNKELELRQRQLDDQAAAARASGAIQLGEAALTGGLLLKDTKLGKAIGSKVSGLVGGAPGEEAAVAGSGTASGVPAAAIGTGATTTGGTVEAGFGAGESLGSQFLVGAGAGVGAGVGAAEAGYGAGTSLGSQFLVGPGTEAVGTAAAAEASGGLTGALSSTAAPALAGAGIGRVGADLLFGGDSTAKDVGTIGGAGATGFLLGGPIGGVIGLGIGVAGDFVADQVGTVICSELHRQGYIPWNVLYLDGQHRVKTIDDETYKGYLRWAEPTVRLMKKSRVVTQLIRPFGVAWAHEMAHREDPKIEGHWLGKILIKIGVPICKRLGRTEERYARVA